MKKRSVGMKCNNVVVSITKTAFHKLDSVTNDIYSSWIRENDTGKITLLTREEAYALDKYQLN